MIYSFSPFGYEGALVNIEIDLRKGIPATDIIGLADGSIKEARERVQWAIKNSGFEYPPERVLISLSPADIKKEGAGFDLPIALSILETSKKEEMEHSSNTQVLVMGELDLSGKIRCVKGVYSALQTAVAAGIKYAIIPKNSEKEPDGILCHRADTLEEAFYALKNLEEDCTDEAYNEMLLNQKNAGSENKIEFTDYCFKDSFDKIENGLKFAMTVAVAGRHNMAVWGSPGCGKTMALQTLPLIEPNLLPDEIPSTKRIWSLAGLLKPSENMKVRPFRIPHQTASIEGICGGGPSCRPGEISLAHNGVLFLDEAAEFRSSVLQMLRIPLENKTICLSRAGRTTVYPANFQLFMAINPCPCGNYGNKEKFCLCSAKSIEQYWKKFSAPLFDRIEIRYDCNNPLNKYYMSLEMVQNIISNAWERQLKRQGKLNNELTPQEITDYIKLTPEAQHCLDEAIKKYDYSPRTTSNILKLTRTIADVCSEKETTEIESVWLIEAIKLHPEIPMLGINENY